MNNLFFQFLPIILIFLIVSNNNKLYEFSNTILGKIIAVFIVIYYVSIDTIYGLFVCSLIILFYQSHYKENMDIIFYDLDNNDDLNIDDDNNDGLNIDDDNIYLFKNDNDNKKIIKKNINQNINQQKINESLEDKFRKNNCKNGVLTFKNINIKNEMAEFIFPNMKFNNRICNPCNNTCEITVEN
jgi:hypothetical protein